MNFGKYKGSSILGVALFIFLFYGCNQGTDQKTSEVAAKAETKSESGPEEVKKKKILKINVDMEREEKQQMAADQGFKPWKMKAIDVAEECIISEGIGATTGESEVLSESKTEAVVRVKTVKEGSFKVSLKRIVKPDGIWTATEVEKEE